MSQSLKQIISGASPEKRSDVMRYVSSICGTQGDILARDHFLLLSKIVEEVFEDAERTVLVEAAQTFSGLNNAPRSLILRFAHEAVDVAAPVLRHSLVLNDDDLTKVVETRTEEHRLSVAQRDYLGKIVTDCMIRHSSLIALLAVVRNKGAEFSDQGFAQLAEIAKVERGLGEALSYRGDMPVEIAQSLMKALHVPLKRRLRDEIADTQNVAMETSHKQYLALQKERDGFTSVAKTLIARVYSGEMAISQCVLELCAAERTTELSQVFAGLSELPVKSIHHAMFRLNGTKIVQISKALGLSFEAFEALAYLRIRQKRLPLSQAIMLTSQFESLSQRNARRAVRAMHGALNIYAQSAMDDNAVA